MTKLKLSPRNILHRVTAMRRTFGIKSILRIGVIVIVCRFDPSIGLPTEQPTRFTLNTGDGDVSSTAATTLATSRLDQGRTLVSDSQNNVDTVIAEKTEDPNKTQRSLETIQNMPVTNTRTDTREIVRLETERAQGFLERPVYKPITGILESLFRPTPLVDGIKEQEKYGNSGDKFIGIGRALVNSFEGFSNFLNAVVDLPRNAAKTTSRGITEALNHVGARLIGLE
ncbi:uncharacterized protein LOC128887691 isoform X3 [Hylaeus anthracinus]|uniref:uncharacterized protein LOC128887691 isoform X3 n=1 Tax=Hylaeus anthracinus TaxID=313031 RepID=UPI0023B944FE|nr:uncharacterized protein LOC128887691 isoform X3 [Hylaeus anthracinus]